MPNGSASVSQYSSGFDTFYTNLDVSKLRMSPEKNDKVYHLVLKNLILLSSLNVKKSDVKLKDPELKFKIKNYQIKKDPDLKNKDKIRELKLSFDSEGLIHADDKVFYSVRNQLKEHVIPFAKSSGDIRTNLVTFTGFIDEYLDKNIHEIDDQKLLILKRMLESTESTLKVFYKKYRPDETDSKGLSQSLEYLKKASELVNDRIGIHNARLSKKDLGQYLSHYIDSTRTREDLSDLERMDLIKNKVDSLHFPLLSLDIQQNLKILKKYDERIDKKKIKNQQLLEHILEVENLKKSTNTQLADINLKLNTLPKDPSDLSYNNLIKNRDNLQATVNDLTDQLTELRAEQHKYAHRLSEFENQSEYLAVKRFVEPYLTYQKKYEDQVYDKIFSYGNNRLYKNFVDHLKCYPDEENRSYLLANLLLQNPDPDTIKALTEKLEKINQVETKTENERKKEEILVLKSSELFESALEVIEYKQDYKKKAVKADYSPKISHGWIYGKAAGKIVVAGGITTLAIFFPKAVIALPIAYKLGSSAVEDITITWKNATEQDKKVIKNELEQWLNEGKNNPNQFIKSLTEGYKGSKKETEEMKKFLSEFCAMTQRPDHYDKFKQFVGHINT